MKKKDSYEVHMLGGSIGSKHGTFRESFDDRADAREYAKRMNNGLSQGEKSYYKMRYTVRTVKS